MSEKSITHSSSQTFKEYDLRHIARFIQEGSARTRADEEKECPGVVIARVTFRSRAMPRLVFVQRTRAI